MLKRLKPNDFPLQLAYDAEFAPTVSELPKSFSKRITGHRLCRQGFREVSAATYVKSFSGVLTLEIHMASSSGKEYGWSLIQKNFQAMIGELGAIRDCLNKNAEGVYNQWILTGKGRKDIAGYVIDMYHGSRIAFDRKRRFFEEYNDFLNVAFDVRPVLPYFRTIHFFLDACHTTKDLNLYFEFMKLFLHTFGQVKESTPYVRKVGDLQVSIAMYYAMLYTIKKIRAEWRRPGAHFNELNKTFSMIPEEIIEKVISEESSEARWDYRSSDLALAYAAKDCGTSRHNFKQLLKKEKQYAAKMKCRIASVADVERYVGPRIVLLSNLFEPLKTGRTPKRELIELIKIMFWAISYYLPKDPPSEPEELLPLVLLLR